MTALVTGVAGFIGSHLAERLLADGAAVIGVDCFTDYYARERKEANLSAIRPHKAFRLMETAIQDADWPALLRGVTHVYHLAAQPGIRGSWGRNFRVYSAHNIEATQTLLEACRGAGLERFVHASSSSVYGDAPDLPLREDSPLRPISPYGATKVAAEHLCRLYQRGFDVPVVSLRYFTVYGPRQRPDMAFHRFLAALRDDAPLALYGDGRQTRDFTFVSDAVSATVAAGQRGVPGAVYNIGGGTRAALGDVLALMAQCTARSPRIEHAAAADGDMRDTWADTTRAREDLGYAPSVTLEQGIAAEYTWISANT